MQAKEGERFSYLLRNERKKELMYQIQRELPGRQKYNIYEVQFLLKVQGYHLEENQIIKFTEKLYNKKEDFMTIQEIIGIYARLSIDQQVEADFRRIFQFFAGREECVSVHELKTGLIRLGQNLKDREINEIFVQLDLNYNGFINFQTFLEAMLRD